MDLTAEQTHGRRLAKLPRYGVTAAVVELWLTIALAVVSDGLYRLRVLLLGSQVGELFSRRADDHGRII